MRVHLHGVSIATGDALPLSAFFRELSDSNYEQFEYSKLERVIAVRNWDNFHAGYILTGKDHKNIVTWERSTGQKRKAKVIALPDQVDFTYFLVSKKTQSGLVTTYQGSGGVRCFESVLKHRYNSMCDSLRKAELNELEELGDTATSKQRNEVRSKYKQGQFEVKRITDNQNWEELLKTIKKFRSFQSFEPEINQSRYSSVRGTIRLERRTLEFNASGSRLNSRIRNFILDFVKQYKLDFGMIRGDDAKGDPVPVEIDPKMLAFDSFKHDIVADISNFDIDTISSDHFFNRMKSVILKNRGVFLSKIE